MEVEAAKLIGAGLAVIGLGGVGAGIGNIFSLRAANTAPMRGKATRAMIR